MGCDIHMFTEIYNTKKKKWEKVGAHFVDNYIFDHISNRVSEVYGLDKKEVNELLENYFYGKDPKNNFEVRMYKLLDNEITDDPNFDWWRNESKLPYPYTDQPYQGRNYRLFGALAGVRDTSMDPVVDIERGLPKDVSKEICRISDEWGVDGHSHNYLYLDEILQSSYMNMTNRELDIIGVGSYFFKHLVPKLVEFAKNVGVNNNQIRLVFWFDN